MTTSPFCMGIFIIGMLGVGAYFITHFISAIVLLVQLFGLYKAANSCPEYIEQGPEDWDNDYWLEE